MTTPAATTAPYPRADIAAAVDRALRRANDPARPGLDATRTSWNYAGLAQDFRNGAWKHLDEGDLPQASNKAWGLVAETIKAISAHHGGFIHKHRSISEVVIQLCQLLDHAGDPDSAHKIVNAFATANHLHANFYENELAEYFILRELMECEELSDRLFALFWPAGAAPVVGAAERC